MSVATPARPARRLKPALRSSEMHRGVARAAYRTFRPALEGERPAKARVLGLVAAVVALELARPWPAMLLFDRVLLRSPGEQGVFGLPLEVSIVLLTGLFAGITILAGSVAVWSAAAVDDLARIVATRVRRQVLEHLHRLQVPSQVSARGGELVVRMMGDVSVLRDAVFGSGAAFVQRGALVAGMAVLLFWLDPLLAVCALFPLPALALAPRGKADRDAAGPVGTTQLLAGAGLALVLFVGTRRVLDGVLTPGQLLVAVAYARAIHAPLRRGRRDGELPARAMAGAARVLDVLERKPERSGLGIPPRRLEGDVAFRHVSMGSPPAADALDDATFGVRPGTVAVVAGPDGSGVPALIALLLKLRPADAGQVLVDGRPVEEYEMHSYRKCFAYVPRDLQLFAGTIHDNILYGRPDATDAEVDRAAAAALVADDIEALPAGYDTVLGEGGHVLTAGQARRLVLARAALRTPSILVLHEPFDGLDAPARASVAAAVRSVAGGHTTLVLGADPCGELRPDVVFHLVDGRIGGYVPRSGG